MKFQAKDVKGKCEHSQPIYVPCDECVNQRLSRIVAYENEETKKVVKDSMENLVRQDKASRDMADMIRFQHEKTMREKAKLAEDLAAAAKRYAELKNQVRELEVQLGAERASKIVINPVVDMDEDYA